MICYCFVVCVILYLYMCLFVFFCVTVCLVCISVLCLICCFVCFFVCVCVCVCACVCVRVSSSNCVFVRIEQLSAKPLTDNITGAIYHEHNIHNSCSMSEDAVCFCVLNYFVFDFASNAAAINVVYQRSAHLAPQDIPQSLACFHVGCGLQDFLRRHDRLGRLKVLKCYGG